MPSWACDECGKPLIERGCRCRSCSGGFCVSCINNEGRCDFCEMQVVEGYGDEVEEDEK